ncbi:MAG: hypothetical protein AB2L11_05555 [Syntrophobacteraceae bacterium]
MSTKDAGAEETRLDIDFAAFEREIDKEIDELLVPLAGFSEEEQPTAGATDIREEKKTPESAPVELREAVISEIREPEVAEPQPVILEEEAVSFEELPSPASSKETELHSLLDSFNVAYLSFDWEFSVENISGLEVSLARLEPYCETRREALSTYKILKMVLQRLKSRPDSASASLIEIIRAGQDLLKRILVLEGDPGADEREELRSLIKLVEFLRKRTTTEAEVKPEPMKDALPPEEVSAPATMLSADREPSIEEVQAVTSLKEWMSHYRHQFSEVLNGIQEENRKLFQIEGVLNKKPAMAPLTERLTKIRSALDEHMALFRVKEKEWFERLDQLSLPDGITDKLADAASDSLSKVGNGLSTEEEIKEADAVVLKETLPEVEPESQREQVCLFSVSGKSLGVLSLHVVRTKQVSKRKIEKIITRGYATLSDFKPVFRNLETDVSGVLSGLPASDLRNCKFFPLPLEAMNAPLIPSSLGSVILVSNGRQHGMILSETEAVELRDETVIRTTGSEGVKWIIKKEGYRPIEVLDVDSILQKTCREQ